MATNRHFLKRSQAPQRATRKRANEKTETSGPSTTGRQATRREADIDSETATSTRIAPNSRNDVKCSFQRL